MSMIMFHDSEQMIRDFSKWRPNLSQTRTCTVNVNSLQLMCLNLELNSRPLQIMMSHKTHEYSVVLGLEESSYKSAYFNTFLFEENLKYDMLI